MEEETQGESFFDVNDDSTFVENEENTEDTTADTEEKSKMIPESRFKEVYGKMKDLEREIGTLREGKKDGTLSEDQQKELQAKEYLKGLLKETLEEQKKNEEEVTKQELEKFNDEVTDLLDVHTDVKKADFLKFLEDEGDDYSSLNAAMKAYKRISSTASEAAEKTKKDFARKPSLPTHEGKGADVKDYSETDKNKSLWQIAQEAAAELKKSK